MNIYIYIHIMLTIQICSKAVNNDKDSLQVQMMIFRPTRFISQLVTHLQCLLGTPQLRL